MAKDLSSLANWVFAFSINFVHLMRKLVLIKVREGKKDGKRKDKERKEGRRRKKEGRKKERKKKERKKEKKEKKERKE